MNRERLVFSCGILRHFINDSLGLTRQDNAVSGFELAESLLDSAAYNTYVEVTCNKSDTLYLRCKETLTGMMRDKYLDYIRRLSEKFGWKEKSFMLAFDYTEEDFYGDVQGLDIHGWKRSDPQTGKFKFLTCSVVGDDAQKIPLLSVPIQIGHYKSYTVTFMLSLIKSYIGEIKLILFDRGFYDKDLMYELIQAKYPFLIFVPKHQDKKEILYPMEAGDAFTVIWDSKVNKDKSNHAFEFYLTFMKKIYDKKSDSSYDWVFATNTDTVKLEETINTYKKRWSIETSFRVQDEARIKCKSKDMNIRYFLFLFQQMLQTQWVCFYKEEVSFKRFMIEMHKTCKSLVANPKRSYGKNAKTHV